MPSFGRVSAGVVCQLRRLRSAAAGAKPVSTMVTVPSVSRMTQK